MKTFPERIRDMNEMYELPISQKPTLPVDPLARLKNFPQRDLADLLADLQVYCRSEALRWGIPHEEVLNIVMDSNASKLGADGKPIKDERGKFLKGPNYWRPEPKIADLIRERMK